MFKKQPEPQPTKYDEIITQERLDIIYTGREIVELTKSIIAKQKVISALDGDAYIVQMMRIEREKLHQLIDKRDDLIAKQNEMLEKGAYERVTTLNYEAYHKETREWLCDQINYYMW